MEIVDKGTRIIIGIFIMFIGWAVIAIAMSFAQFTHSLVGATRMFVALPLSVVFGTSSALIILYGLLVALGVYQIPRNISVIYGGK